MYIQGCTRGVENRSLQVLSILYSAELRPRCEIAYARWTVDQVFSDRRYRYGRQGVWSGEWRGRGGGQRSLQMRTVAIFVDVDFVDFWPALSTGSVRRGTKRGLRVGRGFVCVFSAF